MGRRPWTGAPKAWCASFACPPKRSGAQAPSAPPAARTGGFIDSERPADRQAVRMADLNRSGGPVRPTLFAAAAALCLLAAAPPPPTTIAAAVADPTRPKDDVDRKSTRLNSSHA